jgi:hypothetical protein
MSVDSGVAAMLEADTRNPDQGLLHKGEEEFDRVASELQAAFEGNTNPAEPTSRSV